MALQSNRQKYEQAFTLKAVRAPVDCVVEIPGSKSITNRALLLAALASGESVLRQPLYSDDTEYMIASLRALGATIEQDGGDLKIYGVGGKLQAPNEPLFIGNSGTSVRFLTAACVHLPEMASVVIDGIERMRQRPIQDLIDALRPLGASLDSELGTGCPPVKVFGGGLDGGKTTVSGSISSQYLSALMMSAPLARRDVTINISGSLVSQPYVAMTSSVMRSYGVETVQNDDGSIFVVAPQTYKAREYAIEPDASNASYFLAAAAVTGGTVTIKGLSANSVQGDVCFANQLSATGCVATYAKDSITVKGPDVLRSVDIDLTLMPDMAQTMAVVCLFAKGRSVIRGIHTLRVKETDRIAAIANELRKLGAKVEYGDDYWIIDPPVHGPEPSGMFHTYDDHRMAMSAAVAGLKIDGLIVQDPGCVAKTFPDFWQRWENASYGAK